jgi:hypothetical protein
MPRVKGSTTWSDEALAEVRRLWLEGREYPEIAEMLDPPVTKNALIARLNRMGLYYQDQPRGKVETPRRKKSPLRNMKARMKRRTRAPMFELEIRPVTLSAGYRYTKEGLDRD